MPKFVQLHPYDRKEGHLYQRLTVRSKRMSAGRWYKVSDAFAAHLETIRQPHAPGSTSSALTPLAFEIAATQKAAAAVEKASKPKTPTERTEDLTGNDLKTTDLTGAEPKTKTKSRSSRRSSRSQQ